MLVIRAEVTLSGDAEIMLAECGKFDQRLPRRQVQLTVHARAPSTAGRQFGKRSERTLPVIVNGDAAAAYRHVEHLLERNALTKDEAIEVNAMIERFADLTR